MQKQQQRVPVERCCLLALLLEGLLPAVSQQQDTSSSRTQQQKWQGGRAGVQGRTPADVGAQVTPS
jgi:hypothetical protein